ncbi:DegT/DnrJ/EryC1/StrS family aminotransferase [Acidisphaera rubrifaciens]|uniref:Aminotransferase/pleiotropic regulatory protein DegT/DnrJ/EryC22/StrS n=1 Tax=Acidisphaera rubrifaciens HS-AP3 TaxID=1231350 RepID=A0A0D6P4P8_9PROT|nr:DegT/DnrJ/EryC1/StrS family aminotransferase [Acidisphaera rubrifaciens]GAN76735.1 aminotransferase/pleiotropic regulatory protein DegT/DnrJ/EryC22/StrS [Acidisphaera rubrifaciens HS-AP3]
MIPFLDLARQNRDIEDELAEVVGGIIRSGAYVLGPYNTAFEADFAEYCGAAHAVAVSSGTAALHLALLAAGVGPGDEVITVPMTFVATIGAIEYAGAVPRLVDIDPATWTMDPARVEAAITHRTRAIMPVHLHGRLADMAPIRALARAYGLVVIEDAAQAHGAQRDGRRAGTWGDIGCFSFYPGKNLGACGEGGAVVTDNPLYADRVRTLRHWGQGQRYVHEMRGFNYRMDEIQAAVLAIRLRRLEGWTAARRLLAEQYHAHLSAAGITTPPRDEDGAHVHHVFAVRVPRRDEVRSRLADAGVQTGVHYPIPVHLQPAYADLGYAAGAFPVAERLARETLSLPLFPGMTADEVAHVCDALSTIIANERIDDALAVS